MIAFASNDPLTRSSHDSHVSAPLSTPSMPATAVAIAVAITSVAPAARIVVGGGGGVKLFLNRPSSDEWIEGSGAADEADVDGATLRVPSVRIVVGGGG
ncbi:hypothetical protein CGMCC3_g17885 [Colletotrichum fructicola]|nr:uncharacterized protein CGMCC3_g17885 [Colletotrichum fructicola]KAE9565936.1 hypothetical protein CGMCC3_g17885 [Colletotrichum fructicola]